MTTGPRSRPPRRCSDRTRTWATTGPAAPDDGTNLLLLRTTFDTPRFEILREPGQQPKLIQRSTVEPDKYWEVSQTAHTIRPGNTEYNPRSHAAKTVRMVSPEAFRKDPVRLVRAYRMAAICNFSIDRHTQTAIATDADLIRKSAAERIREELFKILQCSESHPYLAMMAHNELLFSIFPEFLKLKQQQLPAAGSGTLFDRTLQSYNHLEILLNQDKKIRRPFGDQPFPGEDADRSINLKWAMLFHDLGRPGVDLSSGEGQSGSPEVRADESALMAKRICRSLRFSRRHSDTIELIIRQHVKPMKIFGAHTPKSAIEKEFIRLFLDCNDVTPDVLLLALAAFRGRKEIDDLQSNKFTEFIQMLIKKYVTDLRPRASLPPPINGNDLIDEFGIKPSAEFKGILKRIDEKRLSQPVYTRKEALKLVAELLARK